MGYVESRFNYRISDRLLKQGQYDVDRWGAFVILIAQLQQSGTSTSPQPLYVQLQRVSSDWRLWRNILKFYGSLWSRHYASPTYLLLCSTSRLRADYVENLAETLQMPSQFQFAHWQRSHRLRWQWQR